MVGVDGVEAVGLEVGGTILVKQTCDWRSAALMEWRDGGVK